MDWVQLGTMVGTSLVTGFSTYFIARNTNKTTLTKAKVENDVSMDEINNKQSLALFEQYAKINADLSNKVDKLQSKMEKMSEEFDNFKKKSEKEKSFLEDRIEVLTGENDDLKEENIFLRVENKELKEIIENENKLENKI